MKYNQRQVIILRCKIYLSQDIPRGELHGSLEAKKTDNKVKNRYTTIYPCMYYTF